MCCSAVLQASATMDLKSSRLTVPKGYSSTRAPLHRARQAACMEALCGYAGSCPEHFKMVAGRIEGGVEWGQGWGGVVHALFFSNAASPFSGGTSLDGPGQDPYPARPRRCPPLRARFAALTATRE